MTVEVSHQTIGMIDWLTLIIDCSLLNEEVRKKCFDNVDKVLRISPAGELRWEVAVRESIRSDSHQVTVKFGSTLQICGSPARVVNVNNVFGSIDIKQCALDMIRFAAAHYQIFLPMNLRLWRCSKIDVTQNFDMGSLTQVQSAIDQLKLIKVGRQRTSTEDTSVTYGAGSSLHMGKVYAKGPHSRKLARKSTAVFTEEQLEKADRLLRLEYSMRRHQIRRIKENAGKDWFDFTPEFLLELHRQYFRQFISEIEVVDMDNVLDLLLSNVGEGDHAIPTEGQARSAYNCYTTCRLIGYHEAKKSFTGRSWYRHLKNLRSVGLVAADLQPINVVPLRRRQIVLGEPVSSWDQINLMRA